MLVVLKYGVVNAAWGHYKQSSSLPRSFCLFRLSLGRQDRLQNAILEIHRQSHLQPNATPESVRDFVKASAEAKARLDYFKRYVPTRFLAPWFADRLRGEQDFRRERQIEELAKESQKTPFASLLSPAT
jgi:hypothetical protein